MGKEYVPEYANGEILVCYLDHPENDRDFAKVFGSRILGYKLKGEWKHGDSVFIYETIIGKEEEVCQRFRKQKKFVDWAER